ncbi:MoxR-like ATPase [Gammaproteobacteria bacterium]
MSFPTNLLEPVQSLARVADDLKLRFAWRDTTVDLMMLALVSRENLLLLGPHGVGRSALANQLATSLQCDLFQYQIRHDTETGELFNSTAKSLDKTALALLEDVFLASSPVLNALLCLIRDRITGKLPVSAQSVFVKVTELPDDPTVQGFLDQITLRCRVDPVPDSALSTLLEKNGQVTPTESALAVPFHLDQIVPIYQALPHVTLGEVPTLYLDLLRRMRLEGITFSDRRIVRGLLLVRAAALLDQRTQATPRDLWPLLHLWNTPNDLEILRDIVQPVVSEAGGSPLLENYPSLEDLREDLAILETRKHTNLKDTPALNAHLTALSQIRRDLMLQYPNAMDLITRAEAALEWALELLSPATKTKCG